MPALLLTNFPVRLHRKLKQLAARERRSMKQQAMVILENALEMAFPRELPPPVKGRIPITSEFINQAKRAGRP